MVLCRVAVVLPREDGHLSRTGQFIAVLSYGLLFLCMTYPTVSGLVFIKASVFGLLLTLIVVEHALVGRSRIAFRTAVWTVGVALLGFFFILEGMFEGTPGAVAVTTVYVLWPLAFTLWVAGLAGLRFLVGVGNVAICAVLFIGVYGVLYLLSELGTVPWLGFVPYLSLGWSGQAFGAYAGYTKMAIPGLNSLPFLLPFVMASLVVGEASGTGNRVRRVCLWASCVLGWAAGISGGRRAIMLLILLTPLVIVFFRRFQPESERSGNRRAVAGLFVGLVLGILALLGCLARVYQFNLSDIWAHFSGGFNLGSGTPDVDAVARHEQLVALLVGWLQRPIFGAGHGASVLGSIRSEEMPWGYELTYLALLYQTGIVGFMLYGAAVLWIFRQGVRIIRRGGPVGRVMLPMLVGFASLLVANGTNPYLLKFDGMWMAFLPLAVVNYGLLMEEGESRLARRVRLSSAVDR